MSEFVYKQEHWELGTAEERIHHLRRIVLLHSILYYKMDSSIVTDAQFDAWARELAHAQRDNPKASQRVHYHREAFADFTGATGFHLPLDDERANNRAQRTLMRHQERAGTA
jgi:hypothetical protein